MRVNFFNARQFINALTR